MIPSGGPKPRRRRPCVGSRRPPMPSRWKPGATRAGFACMPPRGGEQPLRAVAVAAPGGRIPSLSTASRNPSAKCNGDRFIPDRSTMDMDMAHYLLMESRKDKENAATASPTKQAYRKLLAEKLLNNRIRILTFRNKPPELESILTELCADVASLQAKPAKQRRYIPHSAERTLDAPELVDDYYLNLLDWGSSNVLSIALGNTVYLWYASNGSTSELITIDEDNGPVTSVSLAPDGRHIAFGLNSSVSSSGTLALTDC